MLRQFVDEFSEEEVQALIRLVDQVPMFTEHMETDIMPILATLDRVGPDVHELLDVLKDVRLAIQGVPGFWLLRRRGADRDDDSPTSAPHLSPAGSLRGRRLAQPTASSRSASVSGCSGPAPGGVGDRPVVPLGRRAELAVHRVAARQRRPDLDRVPVVGPVRRLGVGQRRRQHSDGLAHRVRLRVRQPHAQARDKRVRVGRAQDPLAGRHDLLAEPDRLAGVRRPGGARSARHSSAVSVRGSSGPNTCSRASHASSTAAGPSSWPART